MDTSTAGSFSGNAKFGATSHDPDLVDLALPDVLVALTGQVNNFALSAFQFGSGAGTFTQVGSTYTLDYGTQFQGSGIFTSTLFAGNGALGPADFLDGMFALPTSLNFDEMGFNPFTDLAAQQFTAGPLDLAFNTSTLGSFVDTIVLIGTGHNCTDAIDQSPACLGSYSGRVPDITLIIEGEVIPRGTAPEPGTLALLALACMILLYRVSRARAIIRRF
jgi:hypothetical protein